MCRRPLLFTAIISLLLASQSFAQSSDIVKGMGIEANWMAGKIVKHTPKFLAPIPALSTAVDVNFAWQTWGRKEWQQRRHFPVIGIGVLYTDYGNDTVFGHCIGIYPNIQLPLVRKGNWEWTLRIGNGLSYVTRKYQAVPPIDTLNNAIGTHLNDLFVFLTDVRYHFNEHWHLQAGANFTHISNGDYRQPNLGVNMVGGHLGVQYFPASCKPKCVMRELPKLKNRWLMQARAGIAYTQSRSEGNPELPTYLGSLYVSRRWRSHNKMFGGVDYSSSESTIAFLKLCRLYRGDEQAHSWNGSIFVGNEFLIGRVGFHAQIGAYYKQTYLAQDPVYEKFGLNLYLVKSERGVMKELFLSALVKVHEIRAEYAEFGIGAGF